MNLNEAIIHCEEKAKELRAEAEELRDIGEVMSNPKQPYNEPVKTCLECAHEHEQLAEWLEELKTLRKAYKLAYEDGYKKGVEDILLQLNGTIITNQIEYRVPYGVEK